MGTSCPLNLRPDTIMIDEAEKNCFILDAKYYSYGALSANPSRSENSGTSEGDMADDEWGDSKSVFEHGSSPQENMATAAMLQYIGYAEACWNTAAKESYRKIHGFLLDTKRTMELWGRSNGDCQRELKKAIMEKAKV